MRRVPTVDHRHYRHGTDAQRAAFLQSLGEGLQTFGFVNVVGHPVPAELIDDTFAAAERVFALGDEALRAYERPQWARQRGYTPFARERAKGRATSDLKSFWHVGRELPADHPYRVAGHMPPNVFPTEVPEFEDHALALFRALEGFAVDLLHGVAAFLGESIFKFTELVTEGNSVLRVIHYPDASGPPGAVRAAAHEDINLLTVLPAATRPGLELKTRDGVWMPVDAPPGALVCDTGDMMALLTGGRMPATTHRVVNPEGPDGGRLSMPFFMHPHPDAVLAPLDGSAGGVRAHDFLLERLAANHVG